MSHNILLLDDNELIIQMLTMICQAEGYLTHAATNFAGAQKILETTPIDLIVTDLNLPDITGHDTITALRQLPAAAATIPIIIISGQPQATLDAIASERGAQAALSKDGGFPAIASALPVLIKSFT